MKKKIIVILLIFSLFLLISAASAVKINANDSNDLIISNGIDDYSTNGLLNGLDDYSSNKLLNDESNENFNSDNEQILKSDYLNKSINDSKLNPDESDYILSENKDLSIKAEDDEDSFINDKELKTVKANDDSSVKDNVLDKKSILRANEKSYYISPSGTGRGLSINDPTNWKTAYLKAENGDTIYFLDGTYRNINNFNITKNLNLVAINTGSAIMESNKPGLIIGESIKVIFFTNKYNITFNGLVFKNGTNRVGAISSNTGNILLINTTFINNRGIAKEGGAVSVKNGNLTVIDSLFINNRAVEYGGAVSVKNGNLTVIDSLFINNSARYGGAVYAEKINALNSLFKDNTANSIGGGLYIESNASINNCEFDSNMAINGGALFALSNSTVINSNFTNNSASDGAAIISENLVLYNSYFENNTSRSYGVIYATDAIIENNIFTGNHALEDKIIYVLRDLNIQNNNLEDNQIESVNADAISIVRIDETRFLFELENGLSGYCLQRTLNYPRRVYFTDDLSLAVNQLSGEDVSEYIKILIYKHVLGNNPNLAFDIWEFTDTYFRNSINNVVKNVIELYDSGFRVPDTNASLIAPDGRQVIIDFYVAGDSVGQNLFLYNLTYLGRNFDLMLEKISLNKTVINGNQVQFLIRIRNIGDTILHNAYVKEKQYEGLIYDGFVDENNIWSYDDSIWTLSNPLGINETRELIVLFNTTGSGNFTNLVLASSDESDAKYADDFVLVFSPDMEVEKICLNQTVFNGNQVSFLIKVSNTGDLALNNVLLKEIKHDGLVYDSYIDEDNVWSYDEGIWTLLSPLDINETHELIVLFNTTGSGNFTNLVLASSDETDDKSANDFVLVFSPDMEVEKICLNQTVFNGDQVSFLIKVSNTGDLALNNVLLKEIGHDGLVYDSYIDEDNLWSYDDGIWTLSNPLGINETRELIVLFNTTMSGNFSNTVIVSCGETADKVATSDITTVYTPNLTIDKICQNETVNIGENFTFTVTISNNGDCGLNGIFIRDNEYDDLVYISFEDNESEWTFDGIDTWTYNNELLPNESISLNIIFQGSSEGIKSNNAFAGHGLSQNQVNSTCTVVVVKIENNQTVDDTNQSDTNNSSGDVNATGPNSGDINGTGSNGTEPNPGDVNGTDPGSGDVNGTSPNGTEPNPGDVNGTSPNGTEPNPGGVNGTDVNGTTPNNNTGENNGTDVNGTGPNSGDVNGTSPNGTDPNPGGVNGTDVNGTDPGSGDVNGTSPNGTDPTSGGVNGTDVNGTSPNNNTGEINGTDVNGTSPINNTGEINGTDINGTDPNSGELNNTNLNETNTTNTNNTSEINGTNVSNETNSTNGFDENSTNGLSDLDGTDISNDIGDKGVDNSNGAANENNGTNADNKISQSIKDKNQSNNIKAYKKVSNIVPMPKAGNPLLLLIICILAIFAVPLRNKK